MILIISIIENLLNNLINYENHILKLKVNII